MGKRSKKTAPKVAPRAPAPPPLPRLPPLGLALPASIGFGTLLVYTLTLYPTVPPGDSGELIAAAYSLGVAHPPGYPLHTLLGKLFTLIPYGSVAWRVNVLSAACGAVAAVFLFLAVTRLSRNVWGGLVAAGLFAFAPIVWAYAIAAEVFALNNLLLAALFYLIVRYLETREWRIACAAALTLGLGISNHHAFVLFAAPMAVGALWVARRDLVKPRRLLTLAALACAGLLPYLYLPIAAQRPLLASWGDASTLDGLWHHLLRRDYGTFRLGAGAPQNQLGIASLLYFRDLPHQSLYVGPALALIGLYRGVRDRVSRAATLLAAAALITYIVVFFSLSNLPIDNPLYLGVFMRFWQQPTMVVCVWAGIGFAALARWVPANARMVAAPVLAVTLVAVQVAINWKAQDQSENWHVHAFGRAILDPLPPNTLLLSLGDVDTNAIRYLQHCENVRRDVKAIDRAMLGYRWMRRVVNAVHPDVIIPPGRFYRFHAVRREGYDLAQLLTANQDRFPIFMSEPAEDEERTWEKTYVAWPYGFVGRVEPRTTPPNLQAWVSASEGVPAGYTPPALRESDPTTWERFIAMKYWDIDYRRALRLLYHSNEQKQADLNALALAAGIMERLAARHPAPAAGLYKNLGLAYQQLRGTLAGAEAGMQRFWRKYLEVAPATDAELPEIRRLLGLK